MIIGKRLSLRAVRNDSAWDWLSPKSALKSGLRWTFIIDEEEETFTGWLSKEWCLISFLDLFAAPQMRNDKVTAGSRERYNLIHTLLVSANPTVDGEVVEVVIYMKIYCYRPAAEAESVCAGGESAEVHSSVGWRQRWKENASEGVELMRRKWSGDFLRLSFANCGNATHRWLVWRVHFITTRSECGTGRVWGCEKRCRSVRYLNTGSIYCTRRRIIAQGEFEVFMALLLLCSALFDM